MPTSLFKKVSPCFLIAVMTMGTRSISVFFYKTQAGEETNFKPSRSGYGVFEGPIKEEQNTTEFCKAQGNWVYDYSKFMTFGQRDDLIFDEIRTGEMLSLLVQEKTIQKVFIEPHLKQRLHLDKETKIRFHGCKAVRHDDHIHVEYLKK